MSRMSLLPARLPGPAPFLRSRRATRVARQVAIGLLTLVLISVVAFAMMSVRTPDQIARKKFGSQVTAVQVEAFAAEHGLDRPVVARYGTWLWGFVHGDMG